MAMLQNGIGGTEVCCTFNPGRFKAGHNMDVLTAPELRDLYGDIERWLQLQIGSVPPWQTWILCRVELVAHIKVPPGRAHDVIVGLSKALLPRRCDNLETWQSSGYSLYRKFGAGQLCYYDKEAQVLSDRRFSRGRREELSKLVKDVIRVEDRLWGRRLRNLIGGDTLSNFVSFLEHRYDNYMVEATQHVVLQIACLDVTEQSAFEMLLCSLKGQRNDRTKAVYAHCAWLRIRELGADNFMRFYGLDRSQMSRLKQTFQRAGLTGIS